MCKIICLLLTLLSLAGQAAAVTPTEESLTFQIVRTAGEEVLWESPVTPADYLTNNYRHSSDNRPVHDLFEIGSDGLIVLIEESYRWYGAGLESHPDVGKTDFTGEWTRVRLHRPFPRFLLRVGKVANHVLTLHGRDVPLLSIARGGDSIWIRATKSVNRK